MQKCRNPGANEILLPAQSVQTREVPGDGDCLFHAFYEEAHQKLCGHFGVLAGATNGKQLRHNLFAYMQRERGRVLDGCSLEEPGSRVAGSKIIEVADMAQCGNHI